MPPIDDAPGGDRDDPISRDANTSTPNGLTRVPPASLATRAYAQPVVKSFAALERDYGGRDQIITRLAFAPHDDRLEYILNQIADPDIPDTESLADLCARGQIRPSELLSYLKSGNTHFAQARASRHLPEHLDQTVADTLIASHRHRDVCDRCEGTGTITHERPATETTPAETRQLPCRDCAGTGVRDYPADPAARKLALELGGLLQKKGAGTTLSVGVQSVVEQGPGGGRLERLQAAIAATFDRD